MWATDQRQTYPIPALGHGVSSSPSDFDSLVTEAETIPFSGWDFSALEGRWRVGHPPWDYRAIAREHLARSSCFLDLGTGGGEFLASLTPLPAGSYATEGYAPNLEVARRRLDPLGVEVLSISPDNRIPLGDGAVDLVLNRHEEFDAREVHRVLSPGGRFVTQQVGGRNCEELRAIFGAKPHRPTNNTSSVTALANETAGAGLAVKVCD